MASAHFFQPIQVCTMKKRLFLMIIAGFAWQVQAQQPVNPDVTKPATGDVPPLSCKQPSPPPLVEPSHFQIDSFNKQLVVYQQCIKDYVGERQKAVKQLNEQIARNTDAANAAIKQFNDFNKSVNERNERVVN